MLDDNEYVEQPECTGHGNEKVTPQWPVHGS
jgi:hypothetical protein